MRPKEIISKNEGREKLLAGADKVANAVKVTLGAKGRNVIIEGFNGLPKMTKDGVSVAKSIDLLDPMENIGAQLIKEVASKTVDMCGDGTTTSVILAQAIMSAGVKAVADGLNPIDIKKGIDKATKAVVEVLKGITVSVENDWDKIKQIAVVSSNGDEKTSEIITNALMKVGKEGVITAEIGKSFETTVEIIEGMSFNQGFISPWFINRTDKQECVLEDCHILVYDGTISALKDILELMGTIYQKQESVLIIAHNCENEALATIIKNRIEGEPQFKVCVVRAPEFSVKRVEILKDIAIATGASLISTTYGKNIETTTITELGRAEKVIVTKNSTIIQKGQGSKLDIEARIKIIREDLQKESFNENEKAYYEKRLARMNNGIAVIYAGGQTQTEAYELKDRIEDAIAATKAALNEGVVIGGGMALLKTYKTLAELSTVTTNKGEATGVEIIIEAIKAPIKQVLFNAGVETDAIFEQLLNKANESNLGYNAKEEKIEDLLEAGIIDPAKVTRVALENAASIGSLLLTTEATVYLQNRELINQ